MQFKRKFFIALLLACFIVLLAQGAAAAETSRFREILTRFSNIYHYTGNIEHEHSYAFFSGASALLAAGRGEMGGVHEGWSYRQDTPIRRTVNTTQTTFTSTAPDALPGQYMRIIGGFEMTNSHSSQSGVEPRPGESGYVKDTVAYSTDEKGKYFEHNTSTGTTDGRTRVSSGIGDSSTNVDVDGTAMYFETTIIDSGGQKTGWWDMQ